MSHMNNPPHPGAMIAEELEELGISAREFARHIGVAPSSVTRILNEEGPITPEMSVKIAQALQGPDADMWLRMQANYDAWQAKTRFDVSHISRILPKAKRSFGTTTSIRWIIPKTDYIREALTDPGDPTKNSPSEVLSYYPSSYQKQGALVCVIAVEGLAPVRHIYAPPLMS